MLISSVRLSRWKDISALPVRPSGGRITIRYNQCGWVLFVLGAWADASWGRALYSCRGSVMDTPVLLVGLIPHLQADSTMMPGPSILYPHSTVGLRSRQGPSAMFLSWHIGEESLSWYLSRQPIIIRHLCLLIVRSFPAVRARVGGLWFQAHGGLSWPWDTREVQPRPHGSGMLWLLIRLSMARSLGIRPSKAFHNWAPGPRAARFRIAFNSCGF